MWSMSGYNIMAYYIELFRRIPHRQIGHLILHPHYLWSSYWMNGRNLYNPLVRMMLTKRATR